MSERPEIPKDFVDRYNHITTELKKLAVDYGVTEYNLFFTKYSDEGKYLFGYHNYKIQHEDNLDAYQDKLLGLKYTLLENRRYCDVLHLKEFRVECINDEMCQELRDIQIKNGGDWIRRGQQYTVYKRKKPVGDTGGYAFYLRDDEGQCLVPPYPYEGFHSSRFKVVDYTKLN